MHRAVSYLALLFLASVVPSNAQNSETPAPVTVAAAGPVTPASALGPVFVDNPNVTYYSTNITLKCALAHEKTDTIVWKKNNTLLKDVPELKNRYKVSTDGTEFSVTGRVSEDDYGNYSCGVGEKTQNFELHGKRQAKLPPNSNAVEGQRLKLQCKVYGKPYPLKVNWRFFNGSSDDNSTGSDVLEMLGADRIKFQENEQKIMDAELVIEAAERSDAGKYTCLAENTVHATTTVRVKDMYAALWPFLGICAEVFILCAIILVYEKRRTKPELDDSDTDNHDQKKS